jgi:hypothetical protein
MQELRHHYPAYTRDRPYGPATMACGCWAQESIVTQIANRNLSFYDTAMCTISLKKTTKLLTAQRAKALVVYASHACNA